LLELYRVGLEMKRQGSDISKPNIAKIWSPYFVEYGRGRYADTPEEAEERAMELGRGLHSRDLRRPRGAP